VFTAEQNVSVLRRSKDGEGLVAGPEAELDGFAVRDCWMLCDEDFVVCGFAECTMKLNWRGVGEMKLQALALGRFDAQAGRTAIVAGSSAAETESERASLSTVWLLARHMQLI